ncbi:MAG: tRNA pseudouridine(38-40) synthase TruA [Clostridiales bacterium]|nr:tRNA pseudouridine(38-40) synthase TruA [Clostridiales bacterium]
MRNLLLTLRYDGTAYHGWQVQKNALSVQEVFQDAVEAVFGARLDVVGCSRTDSGVHANQYCVSLKTRRDIPERGIVYALNTKLPKDIAVTDCRQVPDDFHARYSCKSKQYIYKIYNGSIRDPFWDRYAYFYPWPVAAGLLNREAQAFVGEHDFRGFCSAGGKLDDTVRRVHACSVHRDGDMVYFTVEADGFLYNMVRIMAGTLLFISQGRIAPDALPEIIASADRLRAGKTAPAQGLYLNRGKYD